MRRTFIFNKNSSAATFSLVTTVQSTGNVTTNSFNSTGASAIIVVVVGGYSQGITDNKGNSYVTRNYVYNSTTLGYITIYDCLSPTVGAGHTITPSGTQYPSIFVYAVNKTDGSAVVFDTSSAGFNAGNVTNGYIQPGSITPSHQNELFIQGAFLYSATGAVSVDSGFSGASLGNSFYTNFTSSVNYAGCSAYLMQTGGATTAENPTSTLVSGANYTMDTMVSYH